MNWDLFYLFAKMSFFYSKIFHWSMSFLMIGIGELVSCAAGANFTPHVISVAPGEVCVYCQFIIMSD